MNSTLLLNADASPVNLIPLSTLTWQESCKLMYSDVCSVLHEYENWEVHSQYLSYRIPSVMILKKQINIKKQFKWEKSNYPTSKLLFLRDLYTCQYCLKIFSADNLTIDHVIPKSHGGKNHWNNVVTACVKCNHSRGNNIDIQPKIKPSYDYLLKVKKKFPIIIPHLTWNYYLGWKPELIEISQKIPNGLQSNRFLEKIL